MGSYDETLLKLLLSAILGGVIGYERESAHRPAGLRTHLLVSVGSTLIMMVSMNMVKIAHAGGAANVDPGRIAAQVVSGIGFLGAGTILRDGATIRGLTTAASLWVVAGIGLAVGVGAYLPAVSTSVLILLALIFLSRFEKFYIVKVYHHQLTVRAKDEPGVMGKIGQVLGNHGVNIKGVNLYDHGDDTGTIDICLNVLVPTDVDYHQLNQELLAIEGVKSLQQGE